MDSICFTKFIDFYFEYCQSVYQGKASGIIRAELVKIRKQLIPLYLLLVLSGCSVPSEVSVAQVTSTLIPFPSSTVTPTVRTPVDTPISTPIPPPGPTATPFIHIVQKDDTLLGIAYRYGVSMDEILAANPGIDPRILSIDQEIIIPLTEGDPLTTLLPTATPIPLQLSDVTCYPNLPHSYWCISTLDNSSEVPLEAVSVTISLWDSNNELIDTKKVYSPLNLVPVGAKFPMAANFTDFTGEVAYAMVSPVSAFPGRTVEERFLPITIMLDDIVASENSYAWEVEGRLLFEDSQGRTITRVVILAVGLDEAGQIVGFRKLKLSDELSPGEDLSFKAEIFSLGPPIQSIEVYAEGPIAMEGNE
jgi:LysM repeat protein